jgi:hypothetical protein
MEYPDQHNDILSAALIEISSDDFLINDGDDVDWSIDEFDFSAIKSRVECPNGVATTDESDPMYDEILSLPECISYDSSCSWDGIECWQGDGRQMVDFDGFDVAFPSSIELTNESESCSSFEYQLETTKLKLQETMKRSQETREKICGEALELEIPLKRQKLENLQQAIESVTESASRLLPYLI